MKEMSIFRDCFRMREASEEEVSNFSDSLIFSNDNQGLNVVFEATHSGFVNHNLKFYIPALMKDGVNTFINRKKPAKILKHHDRASDPVGIITHAEYIETIPDFLKYDKDVQVLLDSEASIQDQVKAAKNFVKSGIATNKDFSGLGYIKLYGVIKDEAAIKQVNDKLFDAVSTSFRSPGLVFCSECQQNWATDGMCEHEPGEVYEDEDGEKSLCVVVPGVHNYDECSLVVFDADPFTSIEIGTDSPRRYNINVDDLKNDSSADFSQCTFEFKDSKEEKMAKPATLSDDTQRVLEAIKKLRPDLEDAQLIEYAEKISSLKKDGLYPDQELAEIDEDTAIQYALEDLETTDKEVDSDAIYAEMEQDLEEDAKLSTEGRKKLPTSAFCGPNRSFPVPDCCIFGPQKLKLLDGSELSIKEISEKIEKEEPVWVYSFDLAQKAIVPGRVTAAWKAKSNAELIRVTLDNKETITCTPNHPFLTRDFEYVEAKDLLENQSLMPFYFKDSEMFGASQVYEKIYQPWYKHWEYTHHMVARESENRIPKSDELIHHKNEIKTDNQPDNLEYVTRSKHSKIHGLKNQNSNKSFSSKEIKARSNFMKNRMAHILNDDTLSAAHSDSISKGKRTYDWNTPTEEIGNTGLTLVDIYSAKLLGVETKFIADRIKVNPATVREWLDKTDLSSFAKPTELSKVLVEDFFSFKFGQDIEKMYVDYLENPNFSKLQDKYKIDRFVIKKWFKKAGFEVDRLNLGLKAVKETKESIKQKWEDGLITMSWLRNRTGIKNLTSSDFYNHKVVKVEKLSNKEDVFDLEVEGTNNFALSSGIFVHNSHVTAARRLIGRYKGPGNKTSILACVNRKAKALGCGSSDSTPEVPSEDSIKFDLPTCDNLKSLSNEDAQTLFAMAESELISRDLKVQRECSKCAESEDLLKKAQEDQKELTNKVSHLEDTLSVLREENRLYLRDFENQMDQNIKVEKALQESKKNYFALVNVLKGKNSDMQTALDSFADTDLSVVEQATMEGFDLAKIYEKLNDGMDHTPSGDSVENPGSSEDQDGATKFVDSEGNELGELALSAIANIKRFVDEENLYRAKLLYEKALRMDIIPASVTFDSLIADKKSV